MPKVTPSLSSRFGRFINAPWVAASGGVDRQTIGINVQNPPQATRLSNSTIISIRPQNSTSSATGRRTDSRLEESNGNKAFVAASVAMPWANANLKVRQPEVGEPRQP
jgi:hypothetical protein